MKAGTKKLVIGLVVLVCIVVVGVGASMLFNNGGSVEVIHGAVGGGKENFLADEEINRILKEDYGIQVVNDAWSNGKLIKDPLTYEEKGKEKYYDFAFFSDQRYYEYYQLPAAEGEVPRLPKKKGFIALNTPIVFYSWDAVVDALAAEGVVTESDGSYFVTDMPKLLGYINDGVKWQDLGLKDIYGTVNIASTDPVTSSPGATYYGLLAAIMNEGEVTQSGLADIMPRLQNFYRKSGFMNNTPADLFDLYLRTGMGAKPMIVDYEKSIVDFANSNPEGYEQVQDHLRILYPSPTIWNSHCIISFNDAGTKFVDALNDKRIQEIAFQRYGFRTGVSGGQYDVTASKVSGIPQDIVSVVSGLKMDTYDQIIEGLKAASN